LPKQNQYYKTMEQRVIITQKLSSSLAVALSECEHDKIFVLTDVTTREKCWPLISNHFSLRGAHSITIGQTDTSKNLDSLTHVWEELQKNGATRHSCLINLGGGMVTDLGGFAASTFKRGMNFINIPTTLLAMVDASVGGKTGINFGGLKNEIGIFNDSKFVILDTYFLKTLDRENILSGYAEMIKHGLISDKEQWAELLNFDLSTPDLKQLSTLLAKSVKVKERIVAKDPNEKGIRKALNLGHTFGHAFESWSLHHAQEKKLTPILHGYAVAYGMIPELYLAVIKCGFPADKMRQTVAYIKDHYGELGITCNDYDELIQLMHHDKKNTGDNINVTLLEDIGKIKINRIITEEEARDALDFFRDGI
jgi:3-dehydroquinate synthase